MNAMFFVNKSSQRGFTIVEVLIVIVVIAILAAISVVGYNGIQGRAYSTVLKSDLSNAANKIELYRIESSSGGYPVSTNDLESIDDMRVTTTAYSDKFNYLYCKSTDGSSWAIVAMTKLYDAYIVANDKRPQAYSGPGVWSASFASPDVVCPGALSDGTTTGNSWGKTGINNGDIGWQAWTRS